MTFQIDTTSLNGKTILITGGTGSFGRTLARYLLENCEPEKVIIFSRDEWKQWEMKQSALIYSHPKIRYFLGSIRDKDRLLRAFRDVDIVVHAAALKQVPAAEYNPSEFVKTNVVGAMNIIDAAIDRGVSKVIALSTDKAVNPVNLYGATKLCSDKLFVAGNSYVGQQAVPRFSVVRYGNVLGSRGSIIPFWKSLIREGAKTVPVTDERMTRFWISLEDSVRFVLSSVSLMVGGEIFVPKIPSMNIMDLAKALAPDLPVKIMGIREGEKLHELLINEEESRQSYEFEKHYVIAPQVNGDTQKFDLEELIKRKQGKLLTKSFVYASNTNTQWITVEELQSLLQSPGFVQS